MEKKRLDYLDMVKGFGIILVVLGHMQDISTNTRVWISSLHMPLFFIVSGLIMAVKKEDTKDLKEVTVRKFKGIIVPYMWFSLSYFIIDILNVNVIKNIDLHTFIVDTVSSVTFYGMSVLWFLPCLFIASVGFLFIKKKLPDRVVYLLLILISLISYAIKLQLEKLYDINADSLLITSLINIIYIFIRANIAMSFVGYAYYIRQWYEKGKSMANTIIGITDNRLWSFITGCVMLIINIVLAMTNECCDLRNVILNNIFIYYIAAFLGVYGLILIMKALPSLKLITYFGRNSIVIMAAHVNFYFLYAGIRLAWLIDPFVKHAKHYVFVLIVVTAVMILCSIAIEVIKRFFPFVLGKPYKSNKGR